MAIVGGVSVFLDSVYCGDAFQDSDGQAQLLEEKMLLYGGLTILNAIGSDNTASYLKMRRLETANNPPLVSINDQAHMAYFVLGDLCKTPWVAGGIKAAAVVSSYIRNHKRLLSAYLDENDLYKTTLGSEAAAEKRTAVAYVTPCTTRFCLIEMCYLLVSVTGRLGEIFSSATTEPSRRGS